MKVKIDHRSKFSNLSNWKEELDRRKATKGLALKTLVQRGDEDKMLKCLLMMDDT